MSLKDKLTKPTPEPAKPPAKRQPRKAASKRAASRARGKPTKGKKKTTPVGADLSKGIVAAVRKKLTTAKADPMNISVLREDEVLSEVREWIPTGFAQVDSVFGGGWPVGRIVEIFGPEGAGKSAATHRAIRGCQDAGGEAVFIDFENSLDPEKMEQQGIDPDRLVYCTPDYIEQAWDIIWEIIDYLSKHPPSGPFLFIWDSLAASPAKAEIDSKSAEDAQVAAGARAHAAQIKKLYRAIARVRAAFIFVNQERDVIGGKSFIKENSTPGGRAIKFASTLRCRLTRVATLSVQKSGEKVATGYLIQVLTKKNKVFPPHRKAKFVLDFTHGPSPELSMFQGLLDAKILKVGGGGIYKATSIDPAVRFRRSEWLTVLQENPSYRAACEAAYLQHVGVDALDATDPEEGDEDDPDTED